jgi:hypothetical protein
MQERTLELRLEKRAHRLNLPHRASARHGDDDLFRLSSLSHPARPNWKRPAMHAR